MAVADVPRCAAALSAVTVGRPAAAPSSLPVLVAGGGIGGLAVALALADQHFSVRVLERASTLSEVGAGIQLGPNAFHAFDALGVGDAARRIAVYVDSLRLMDAVAAREIVRIPLDEAFRARFGNPYAVVHRGELHRVLLDACRAHPRIGLSIESEVVDYDQSADKVAAILRGGARIPGAALIGADGLWSTVRAKVVGDGPPRVSGHSTYRSVIPRDEMPENLRWNAATLWAGPRCHVVHYPLSDWKAFNLVVTCQNEALSPVAGQPVGVDEVRAGFEHVHPTVRQIIERGKDWKLWVLCDRDPVARWTDGRVALLGDAAHPMMQYFAQGACMALEDAVALAANLARQADDVPAALETYCQSRHLRTARVQLQSREIGQHIYHPEGAHAALRDAIMGAKTADDWYDTLAWLYGGDLAMRAKLAASELCHG